MTDIFPFGVCNQNTIPFTDWRVVVSSDTVGFTAGVCRALYVGGAGDVSLTDTRGNTNTIKAVTAGTLLYLNATRVNATNTTASSMTVFY